MKLRHLLNEAIVGNIHPIEKNEEIVKLVTKHNADIEKHLSDITGFKIRLFKILPAYSRDNPELQNDSVRFIWRVDGSEQPGDPTFRLDMFFLYQGHVVDKTAWKGVKIKDVEESKWKCMIVSSFLDGRKIIKSWKTKGYDDNSYYVEDGGLPIGQFGAQKVFGPSVTSGITKYFKMVKQQGVLDFSQDSKSSNIDKQPDKKDTSSETVSAIRKMAKEVIVPKETKPVSKKVEPQDKKVSNPVLRTKASAGPKIKWDIDDAADAGQIKKFKQAAQQIVDFLPVSTVSSKVEIFEEGITISCTDKKVGNWTFDITEKNPGGKWKPFYELIIIVSGKQDYKNVSADQVGMTKAIAWVKEKINQMTGK